MSTHFNPDDLWTAFCDVLNYAIDLFIPSVMMHNSNIGRVRRYPSHIRVLFKRKLCLWQQMKRYPHESNLSVRYKQLTLDCRAAVRDFECKQETKLIDSQNINNLYKYINRKLRNSSSCPVLYDQTGSCVYSDLDKAELFNAHFHSVNVDDDGNLPKFSRRVETNTKLDTVQFTAEKIHKVIKRLKPKVTRDPEGSW